MTTKPNSNVLHALENFKMWLGWYPADYTGATEFAGDSLETVEEVNVFERELREQMLANDIREAMVRKGWIIPATEREVEIAELTDRESVLTNYGDTNCFDGFNA
jgi:hypothetical protein